MRKVMLRAGRIAIQTAPDRLSRPFVVETPDGALRPVGTRFTVDHTGDDTLIAVFDGAVDIATAASGASARVGKGWQTHFNGIAIDAPVPAERYLDGWRRGDFMADETRLDVVVAELARYRRGYLGCAPEVAGLRLYGVFPLAGEAALDAIARALPVTVQRRTRWWIRIEPEVAVTK